MSELILDICHADELPAHTLALILVDPGNVPHVTLSCGEVSFSLTIDGVSEKNTAEFFNLLKRKKIGLLTIVIDHDDIIDIKAVKQIFHRFGKVSEEGYSCLEPVKAVLSAVLLIDLSDCGFVYQVIEKLSESALCKKVLASCIDSQKRTYPIRRYNRKDVVDSITAYRNRKEKYAAAR